MMEENKFQREVLDRLVRLETKIDLQDYKGLNEKVEINETRLIKHEQEITRMDKEIDKLNSINKWIITSIIGAILVAIINILIKNAW